MIEGNNQLFVTVGVILVLLGAAVIAIFLNNKRVTSTETNLPASTELVADEAKVVVGTAEKPKRVYKKRVKVVKEGEISGGNSEGDSNESVKSEQSNTI